jgi:hypothetical protein
MNPVIRKAPVTYLGLSTSMQPDAGAAISAVYDCLSDFGRCARKIFIVWNVCGKKERGRERFIQERKEEASLV